VMQPRLLRAESPFIMGANDSDDRWRSVERKRLFGVASIFRHYTVGYFCVVLCFLLGVVFAFIRPMTYTASTQLVIYNRELYQGPEPIISAGRADNPSVENVIEILKSRNWLAKLLRGLQPDTVSTFDSEKPLTYRQVVMNSFADIRRSIWDDKLAVVRVGTSHTILINWTSVDPNKAALIANSIAQSASQVLTNADSGSSKAALFRERLHGLGPSAYVISSADPPIRSDGP
jgi:succinoglycan biosynthesis transport protein ExoP